MSYLAYLPISFCPESLGRFRQRQRKAQTEQHAGAVNTYIFHRSSARSTKQLMQFVRSRVERARDPRPHAGLPAAALSEKKAEKKAQQRILAEMRRLAHNMLNRLHDSALLICGKPVIVSVYDTNHWL